MKKKDESKIKIDSTSIIGGSSYIKYGPHLYEVALLMTMIGKPYNEFDPNTAYVTDNIFYILRGDYEQSDNKKLEPGIYKDPLGGAKIIAPGDTNREEFTLTEENLLNSNLEHIIEVLKPVYNFKASSN